jgi:hypothetical protein
VPPDGCTDFPAKRRQNYVEGTEDVQGSIRRWKNKLPVDKQAYDRAKKDRFNHNYPGAAGDYWRDIRELENLDEYLKALGTLDAKITAALKAKEPAARFGPPPAISLQQSIKVSVDLLNQQLKAQEDEKKRQKEIFDALKKLGPKSR